VSLQGEKMRKLFQRSAKVIPYGVNSNFRYWGDEDTIFIQRGEGTYVWDVDGKKYIDYRLGFGPVILGHAFPAVTDKVREAMSDGNIYALTTPWEVEAAERIVAMCNVDKVRLTNTGTEATMHALRIARAYTNREKFIKFEGQYHGMADYFMFNTAGTPKRVLGSRRSPVNVPMTSGIPKGISDYVITLPYNDPERLEKEVRARWHEIAAIFIEPMMGNVIGIMPDAGFLETMRSLCDEYGIVMVMDEVKTGFRIAKGGAQEYFGVQGDLVTYAKALGNGFPIAAIGGKEEVMMTIEPGAMAHGGTYSGNIVGSAAAVATLDLLKNEPIIETINKRGSLLMNGIGEVLADAGVPHTFVGVPPMFGIVFGTEDKPRSLRDYLKSDIAFGSEVGMGLLKRGVFPELSHEPWFLCYSLSEQDVADTLEALEGAVKEAKG